MIGETLTGSVHLSNAPPITKLPPFLKAQMLELLEQDKEVKAEVKAKADPWHSYC